MRRATRWLALVIIGAVGTTARAQSPIMYGPGPYPYPYAAPVPYPAAPYPLAPRGYAPAPVAPQRYAPQPRVVYVPATPGSWSGGPVPAQTAPFTGPNAAAAPKAAAAPAAPAAPKSSSLVSDITPSAPAGGKEAATKPASPPASDAVPHGSVDAPPHDDGVHVSNWLPKGTWNFQALGGVYSDLGDAQYSYALTTMRFGRVWGERCLSCLPGALESLIEINGAPTVESEFGSFFFGGGLLMRYNFVNGCSRIVPYVQGGVGFQYNDAYHDVTQPYLGSRIELTAQGQLGVRMFLLRNLSLDVEGGLQHISNANMSPRDSGINALGGSAGLTLFFPCVGR